MKWIKHHIKPSNYVEVFRMYSRVKKHGDLKELLLELTKYLQIIPANEIPDLLNRCSDSNSSVIEMIGFDYIPIFVLENLLINAEDVNIIITAITKAVFKEISKTGKELRSSAVFLKIISRKSSALLERMSYLATDIVVMREVMKLQQKLSKTIMSVMMSTNSSVMTGKLREVLENEETDDQVSIFNFKLLEIIFV